MNYIKEINAFYREQETNPLSANATSLWYTLMHINNRTGWKETFTVAVSVLCVKANVSNSTFKRARKELCDKGYIRYESRGGNRSAMYEMVSLVWPTMDQTRTEKESREGPEMAPKNTMRSLEEATVDHKARPLLKQKETKQSTSAAAALVVDFFKENIGVLSPYIKNDLIQWMAHLGEPLVLAAMKRALGRGNSSWRYIKAILQDWSAKGFTTVEEIEREVVEFKQQKTSPLTNEVVPDWFHERKQSSGSKPERVMETAAEAQERKELGELIAAMASG